MIISEDMKMVELVAVIVRVAAARLLGGCRCCLRKWLDGYLLSVLRSKWP